MHARVRTRTHTLQTMAKWANVIKVAQFTTFLACTDWSLAAGLEWYKWVFAAALIGFGQHLNFLVYKLLGVDGVYYGSRFGKTLPWVTAYPYNSMSDPQYVGALEAG
ncbi:hypothetical protein EON67_12145, partial [archaeon]